jgi:hypothetical protein
MRLVAHAVVGAAAAATVSRLFGKPAGLASAVILVAAHEMFDAPVARELNRLVAQR